MKPWIIVVDDDFLGKEDPTGVESGVIVENPPWGKKTLLGFSVTLFPIKLHSSNSVTIEGFSGEKTIAISKGAIGN